MTQPLENPYAAYQKNQDENRKWNSILYKVGKSLALNCPYSDRSLDQVKANKYFKAKCDAFLQLCRPLLVNREARPQLQNPKDDCLRTHKTLGFVIAKIKVGYKRQRR